IIPLKPPSTADHAISYLTDPALAGNFHVPRCGPKKNKKKKRKEMPTAFMIGGFEGTGHLYVGCCFKKAPQEADAKT
ncbi:hypothetical protein PSW56_23420, partial [Shigella flexneri]|nr:hypothetical protein [Shigella flexneri]